MYKLCSQTEKISKVGKIIPVLKINQVELAEPLVDSLIDSGALTVEITLRTKCALEVIYQVRKMYPTLIIGAGTVVTEDQVNLVKEAGADYIVSPGSDKAIMNRCEDVDIELLPGIQTVTEAMTAVKCGFNFVKFFPATIAGGIDFVKAINAVLPDLMIIPTGGINEKNLFDWLSQKNVPSVGGTWIVDQNDLKMKKFKEIKSYVSKIFKAIEIRHV